VNGREKLCSSKLLRINHRTRKFMEQNITRTFDLRYDRVRHHTNPAINQLIDSKTADNIRLYANADKELISRRLDELDREWDMERVLEANAAGFAFTGTCLAATFSRKWLVLPLFVTAFLMQHAIQGWCPPLALFRKLGVRTRKEIERERNALKIIRGDFDGFHSGEPPNPERMLEDLSK
jgi:hypothetical protein